LLFKTGPCADSWRNYDQAVQQWNQLYVKQQQQTAASQATAPLQQQVTMLQEQVQAAHTQGMQQGAGIGVGASLILFIFIFGIKKLVSGFTVTKKTQAKAATAGS
jgi:hypothetical protein